MLSPHSLDKVRVHSVLEAKSYLSSGVHWDLYGLKKTTRPFFKEGR